MSERNDHLQSDEDVEAILRLAVRGSSTTGENLRERLTAAANELGITPEQLAAAEKRYRSEIVLERDARLVAEEDEKLWKEFRRTQMHDFYSHLGVYVAANLGLLAFDMVPDGRLSWAYWPLFAWGILVVIQLFTLLAGYSGENRSEFEKWKRKRLKRSGSGQLGSRKTVGYVSDELKDILEEMVEDGEKIEAIKLLREETGMDLKSAKEFIDDLD